MDPSDSPRPGPAPPWLPQVFLLTLIFFSNFLSRILLSPFLPAIEADLGMSHGEAGGLFLCISIGYFPALVGSGVLAARLFHRHVIALSALGLGLVLMLTAWADTPQRLRSGLVFLGFFAGFYLPSAIATLTHLVSVRHWGKAIAVHELAPNLAFAVAPMLAEAILLDLSWRQGLFRSGLVILLIGIAYSFFGRGGRFHGTPPQLTVLRCLLRNPAFWLTVGLFSLAISSTLGVYTMLPLFLIDAHGMPREAANTLIAASRVLPVLATLAGGWATDRFGAVKTIRWVLLITGGITALMGIGTGAWIPLLVALQPIVAVCFFPAGFRAIAGIGTNENRNLAVGLMVPLAFMAGGGFIPTLIGMMGDAGRFELGLKLLGAAIVAGGLAASRLNLPTERD